MRVLKDKPRTFVYVESNSVAMATTNLRLSYTYRLMKAPTVKVGYPLWF
jgi:hypothetical protein